MYGCELRGAARLTGGLAYTARWGLVYRQRPPHVHIHLIPGRQAGVLEEHHALS